MENRKKKLSQAMLFIILFGIVSLFSDMTHEGASSIRGAYLSLLGASAATIGFISGLGELIGYSMRYVFGKLTDKTKCYWPMTVAGYILDVLAVPALADMPKDIETIPFDELPEPLDGLAGDYDAAYGSYDMRSGVWTVRFEKEKQEVARVAVDQEGTAEAVS